MDNYSKIVNNLQLNVAEIVQIAGSGHPGMGMSAAGLALAVWSVLINDFNNPKWIDRDRIVFSGGQGIILQYMLHYFEGNITKEDLLTFRKRNSRLPGLSEIGSLPTIESTTGSLGHGISNSVGMAIGLKHIGNNTSKVYCILGEGCLEEGISYESMSLAGTLKLNNLIVLYDSNKTSIDGLTSETFVEDMEYRMKSINWDYEYIEDCKKVDLMICKLRKNRNKPLFIEVSSKIAKGSTLEGNHIAHGSPLGSEVVKQIQGYNEKESLQIYQETREYFDKLKLSKEIEIKRRKELTTISVEKNPVDTSSKMNFEAELTLIEKSSKIMNYLAKDNEFLVGSADLARSTKVVLHEYNSISSNNFFGRNIIFGVRENSMSSISSGFYLSANKKVVISTYLAFSDLMKNSIRQAAIMKIPNVYVFTHDGLSLAQDGTTHLPVEQISALRTIPDIQVIRPGSLDELSLAWDFALKNFSQPTILILSRELCNFESKMDTSEEVNLGGYYLYKNDIRNNNCIVCSGSDIHRAIKVREHCKEVGVELDVFSIPNLNEFINNGNMEFCNKDIFTIEMSNDPSWLKINSKTNTLFQINKFLYPGTKEEIEKEIGFEPESIARQIIGRI